MDYMTFYADFLSSYPFIFNYADIHLWVKKLKRLNNVNVYLQG